MAHISRTPTPKNILCTRLPPNIPIRRKSVWRWHGLSGWEWFIPPVKLGKCNKQNASLIIKACRDGTDIQNYYPDIKVEYWLSRIWIIKKNIFVLLLKWQSRIFSNILIRSNILFCRISGHIYIRSITWKCIPWSYNRNFRGKMNRHY